MSRVEKVLAYARKHADVLETEMTWFRSEGYGAYWVGEDPAAKGRIKARAISALEFFRQYAGADSLWTKRALDTYDNNGDSEESGARALGDLLREWADQVDAGVTDIVGARAWTEAAVVSTDLMAQVQHLNADRHTHPAAPIVLCGAALEIALRALADARNVPMPDKPGMNRLATVLRSADVLSAQEVKDLDSLAGIRNLAAHGDVDALSRERAGLMEQQTNMMLRRLADLHP